MQMMQDELQGIRQQARKWQAEAEQVQGAAADRERQAVEDSSEAHRLTLLMSRLLGAAGITASSQQDINEVMQTMQVWHLPWEKGGLGRREAGAHLYPLTVKFCSFIACDFL